MNMLGWLNCESRSQVASTSEVYGDPEVHPGNSHWAASIWLVMLRRRQATAETWLTITPKWCGYSLLREFSNNGGPGCWKWWSGSQQLSRSSPAGHYPLTVWRGDVSNPQASAMLPTWWRPSGLRMAISIVHLGTHKYNIEPVKFAIPAEVKKVWNHTKTIRRRRPERKSSKNLLNWQQFLTTGVKTNNRSRARINSEAVCSQVGLFSH